MKMRFAIVGLAGFLTLYACTHTVEIVPSDKPVRIDMNVNISQEIRVKLDKGIEDLLTGNPDIF